jgi:exocyst complex component 7
MAGPKNAAFAEESAEVEVLLASLSKTKDLTKRIASSLSRLDASGRIVRDAIGPIYSNTQQLQITSRNIDKVNEAIEKLRQPLDARGQEEGIIRAGPKQSGLQPYLGALKRVDRALQDLTSSNLRSNQTVISEFHSLLTTGVNQLNDLYRGMLQEDANPVEPLHYITKQVSFPTLAQDKVNFLSQIASAIASAGATAARMGQRDEDVAARIYAEVRGEYLHRSLQNLAMASVSTAKRQAGKDEIYRQGSSGIGTYVSGIEAMFLAEHENASRIFRNDSPRVLSMTCAKAMSTFARTLSDLNNGIKSRILTDCFLAYEILELATPLAYRIDQRTGAMRSAFSDAMRPIRETARSSLSDVLSQTRSQAEATQTLPPDGNTIPLVSQTATRLQQMAIFDRPLLTMLSSLGEGNWRSPQAAVSSSTLALELTPSTENPTLLSHYLLDIVQGLLDALQKQSGTLHRTKPLQGIFMLNSVAVLQRPINSNADLARYLSISPHNQKLDAYRKAASSTYLSAWREPSSHLLDTISTKTGSTGPGPRPVSGQPIDSTSIIKSLSSKDKDKIKEKFKLFNASFDELVARHKSLHMEKEVKSSVSREIQAMIEPLYGRFWDRYHEVDKGKGKVVKYSKAELGAVLAGL